MDPHATVPQLRAALYARARQEDALDLIKQGHALEAFAEQKGWRVVWKELEQPGDRRLPARERLLAVAAKGEVDVLVAWKLDRIAAGLPELVSLVERLSAIGVALATLADDFDFTSQEAPRIMHILRTLASFQRVTHRDRVRSGLARTGEPVGRPPKAGERLQEAMALAAQGLSQREIARRLGVHPRTVARLLADVRA